ncbi:MAG: histidine kinase dimerization/phospho-acceptor domain-containing protein [Candidatus Andeanibacterium colombiense]|uniref:histidine kinase n=1 Tax=Candidatus Andeanibacterium colombiense TaxID=3121345 RepID=A0AAJ6BMR8_9SPHN|nr:MAG: histidine kinase dimerization/phospho-acceptor domain-containing protein [Sphingomonadaceae bacterium]
MQIDDRLATVLRTQAASERAAHTQFRQLLDLAGSANESDDYMLDAAYERLSALSAALPPETRAAIVREPGVRLRNPGFVAYLASQELPVAAAAAISARLTERQWEALIPALPVEIRALLGRRGDLPEGTRMLLARLGVSGLGLPTVEETRRDRPITTPTVIQAPVPAAPLPAETNVLDLDPALELDPAAESNGIGAIVRRIEAFRRAREQATSAPTHDAPHLPLGLPLAEQPPAFAAFDFTTDVEGRINWAESRVAPMTVGIALADRQADAPARADAATIAALRRRQPLRRGRLVLEGAPAIAGEWRIDAAPVFTAPGGRFTGYRGRMRRPAAPEAPTSPEASLDSPADRMRQVIHELRTPVNAIQGFAEIIQQQLFGEVPNEYRALAAGIAGDAARMLAGFEELDRLVKLETGAMALDPGGTDLAAIIAGTARQLDSVLRPRSAGLELIATTGACPVALTRPDAEMLVWRILATLAGMASPGEAMQIVLAVNGTAAGIEIDLPISLADRADIFEGTVTTAPQAVSAGMFGAGFALRLARAEARAAGGDLQRVEDLLVLTLPLAGGKADKPVDTGRQMTDTR